MPSLRKKLKRVGLSDEQIDDLLAMPPGGHDPNIMSPRLEHEQPVDTYSIPQDLDKGEHDE